MYIHNIHMNGRRIMSHAQVEASNRRFVNAAFQITNFADSYPHWTLLHHFSSPSPFHIVCSLAMGFFACF
ncbi:hypothetical protein K503DRAFT_767077 [Rhizopogon vinicolor AM-OR11-026]|uniref:Uncharacterized protein n=1 Tax=Rhizopogon vinicolor AM-OR11-026 TaxID=1314800 RepID=A0A1B7NBC5_9AGAM|nr:hypothetical protein K503DRAFT_767077 [Rhizopogon vinicolor AM-OR11-026]